MQTEFNSLIQLVTAIPDEQAAIEHFTAIRWNDSAFCPRCGSVGGIEREIPKVGGRATKRAI